MCNRAVVRVTEIAIRCISFILARETKTSEFSSVVPSSISVSRTSQGRPRFRRSGDLDKFQAGASVAGCSGASQPDLSRAHPQAAPSTKDLLRRRDSSRETRTHRGERRAELSAYLQEESTGSLGQNRQNTRPIFLDTRGSVAPAKLLTLSGRSSRGGETFSRDTRIICTAHE